ncbi:MAG: tetratricopeptide repeat protein [Planctomycetota bacterium]|jgi:tetratricopeptide (TPR) repeat protein
MKKLALQLIFALFITAVSFAQPFANEDLSGLYARSINQVLRLQPEEIDLATAVLIISEEWSDNVHGRRYVAKLDDIAFEIRKRLNAKKLGPNYKAISVINDYLFKELGFKSIDKADNPDDLFLHSVLDKKRGYCLSLSILYLAVGERLGLPLYGVVVPGHFFVRYDDGNRQFNIETTSKGALTNDEHYIEKFKVPQNQADNIYMANLSKLQTLGCFFNNLGSVYIDTGNTESALLALERAIEINPTLSETRVNLGNVYLENGLLDEAIYEYDLALAINPADAKTYNNLANAYTRKEWFSKAIPEYNEALELDPNFISAYQNLAIAYCREQLFDMAVSKLKQALEIEPKNASVYHHLGEAYRQMGDYEKAISQYNKALRLEPHLAECYFGLATCYRELGAIDDEIRYLKKGLAIEPDNAAAWGSLGNAYFGIKKYEAAIEQYKRAIEIVPNDSNFYYNLGASYYNIKNYEQAVTEYLRVIEIEPKMGKAHNGLAISFYYLEDYDLAWEHLKRAQELGVEVNKDLLNAIADKRK